MLEQQKHKKADCSNVSSSSTCEPHAGKKAIYVAERMRTQRDTHNDACACAHACACGYICWHEKCFLISLVSLHACICACMQRHTQKDHVHAQRHPLSHLMYAHLLMCMAQPACMQTKN